MKLGPIPDPEFDAPAYPSPSTRPPIIIPTGAALAFAIGLILTAIVVVAGVGFCMHPAEASALLVKTGGGIAGSIGTLAGIVLFGIIILRMSS